MDIWEECFLVIEKWLNFADTVYNDRRIPLARALFGVLNFIMLSKTTGM